VTVKGIATDDQGVASVTVNGVTAAIQTDGTFEAAVPVQAGTYLLQAIAKDSSGNTGKETRAVVVGPMEPIAQSVPESISASISAQAFDAVGRGLTGFVTGPTLMTTVTPLNPVINYGAPNGPDCLYVQGSITSLQMGGSTKITMQPMPGGIYLDATFDHPTIGMSLQYSAACIDGGRPVTATATKIHVTGTLKLGVNGKDFAISFEDQNVQVTGLDVDLGGIPGAIVDLLHIDTAMGPVIGWVTENVAVPYLNNTLSGLNKTQTITVLGTPVDISLKPARVTCDVTGAIIELDSELRAHDDTGSPGFVYVPNVVPDMSLAQGFQMAVADDAANQLLGSFWAAKGMDVNLDLKNGSYGEIGTLYDKVELTAKVPPFVDASGDKLRLTIGDLMATFKYGDQVATQVALNARLDVKVVAGDNGALHLDVGTPEVFVDVMDEGVEGANQLSNSQFEAVASFGLSRVVAFGSGALGAVPLPAFGGVSVSDVAVSPADGYLIVGGDIN
ncbi:MAG TPA: hypothetical protein VGM39_24135, partial [Kofleriaceae bacterium]